jgi:hypothetical protein
MIVVDRRLQRVWPDQDGGRENSRRLESYTNRLLYQSALIPIGVCADRYQTLGFARRRRPTRRAYRSTQASSGIIPTALGIDRCPGAGADGADAVGIVDQKDPGIFTSLDDRIVIVPDESA